VLFCKHVVVVDDDIDVWDLLNERMTGVTGGNDDPSTAYANLIIQIDNATTVRYTRLLQMFGAHICLI
ncbi:hypothetical protein ACFL0M_00775, partial [Thermodesulfobacteriota bacterium]